MKILVTGTRGVPNIQGGVETHCMELYPRLVKMGNNITVVNRKPYVKKFRKEYKGVKLLTFYTPRKKFLEAFVHTFLSIIYAWIKRYQIIHIHAIGPCLLVPLARILGLKVVITNHGPDYKRQKWGKLARIILKLGEKWGTKYANKIIVISRFIKNIIERKYKRFDSYLIYNGVDRPYNSNGNGYLKNLGLKEKSYILAVGRFVPEKGFHDLIDAYLKLEQKEIKLVIAGDADHETQYSRNLKINAKKSGCVLTGFIEGNKLSQIFSNAKLFVLPSFHEGLSIALLEAISYGIDVLASDIPANKEVGLQKYSYFKAGNIQELTNKLKKKLQNNNDLSDFDIINCRFNWDKIAEHTHRVYSDLLQQ